MADCILMLALGIKLALGPNLQVCNPITKTAPNLHWIKLAKLANPASRLGPRCRPKSIRFGGLDAGLIHIRLYSVCSVQGRECRLFSVHISYQRARERISQSNTEVRRPPP